MHLFLSFRAFLAPALFADLGRYDFEMKFIFLKNKNQESPFYP